MSVFGKERLVRKPVSMPPIMPCIPVPRYFDVEIYYNDGTDQKYFNVKWIGGSDEWIIFSKGESDWYILKQAVKYIKRIRVDSEGE